MTNRPNSCLLPASTERLFHQPLIKVNFATDKIDYRGKSDMEKDIENH
ncbi:MAG: hypothetical protein ACKO3K_20250 [Cuspidothrix sp.]